MTNFWTNEEQAIIESGKSLDELKKLLPNRSEGAIRSRLGKVKNGTLSKASTNQRKPRHNWTEEEIKVIESVREFIDSNEIDKEALGWVIERLPHIEDSKVIWRKMKDMGFVWVSEKASTNVPTTVVSQEPLPKQGYRSLAIGILLGIVSEKELKGVSSSRLQDLLKAELRDFRLICPQEEDPNPQQFARYLLHRAATFRPLMDPVKGEFETLRNPTEENTKAFLLGWLKKANATFDSAKLAEAIEEIQNAS
jgi:hypothetical protein